jgi:hypothetical protein
MSLKSFLFKWMPGTPRGASVNITFCEGGRIDEKTAGRISSVITCA